MSRTLVKSPPELWAECSQASSFARHLSGSFGEIRITRLEPETAVAWEGEGASGTVRIEPSGWGTRVTLTAALEEQDEPRSAQDEQPDATEEPATARVDSVSGEEAAAEATETEAAVVEAPAAEAPQTEAPDPPLRVGLMARLRTFFRTTPGERADPAAVLPPEPIPVLEPVEAVPVPEPAAVAVVKAPEPDETLSEPEPEPTTPPLDPPPPDPTAVLSDALDSLGRAHHRPFSRS